MRKRNERFQKTVKVGKRLRGLGESGVGYVPGAAKYRLKLAFQVVTQTPILMLFYTVNIPFIK